MECKIQRSVKITLVLSGGEAKHLRMLLMRIDQKEPISKSEFSLGEKSVADNLRRHLYDLGQVD